jgi:hypothetical protein
MRDIDANCIKIPLPVVAAAVLSVASAVFGIGVVWARTVDHTRDPEFHLDPAATRKGGGLAYQSDIRTEHQRMRGLLKSMEIACHVSPEGMRCRVDLPEVSSP